jgi:hypothetical protein
VLDPDASASEIRAWQTREGMQRSAGKAGRPALIDTDPELLGAILRERQTLIESRGRQTIGPRIGEGIDELDCGAIAKSLGISRRAVELAFRRDCPEYTPGMDAPWARLLKPFDAWVRYQT